MLNCASSIQKPQPMFSYINFQYGFKGGDIPNCTSTSIQYNIHVGMFSRIQKQQPIYKKILLFMVSV